jgi:hypothetical protein
VRFFASVSTLAHVLRTGLRHQREAQGLGLLASWLHRTFLIFVPIIPGAPFPRGCWLFSHVVENFCQFVGRGCRGFGRPECTAHAAQPRDTWGWCGDGARPCVRRDWRDGGRAAVESTVPPLI